MSREYPGVTSAHHYVRDVVAGCVPACRWIRRACERHLKDFRRAARDPAFPYRFDAAKAEKAIRFIELLPHTKGKWAAKKQRIELDVWQRFFVACIFGWVHKETGFRRFRRASLYVPRKNGKSLLVAAIGLYMLTADGEFGAEVYCGATTEKQAWEVFKPARLMTERTLAFRKAYGVEVHARKIELPTRGSSFEPVIGKPGDGASPHCAINDEYHEQTTDELVDTMLTGMGAREQPLMLDATTAGADIAGPCYAHQVELQAVLEGTVEDEELFGLIYTIDDGDDWTSEETLRKANPNFGVSVGEGFLRAELAKAVRSARHQNRFKTKHLNIWVSARAAYYNMEHWRRQSDEGLTEALFGGEACWIGLDLASKTDITAVVKVFRREVDGEDHYYVVAPRFYLPEETAEDPEKKHYQGWVHDGHLIATDGNIIDYGAIREDVVDDAGDFQVMEVAYDPWGATQLAQELQEEHEITVAEVPQRVMYLSEPMKWVGALMKAGRLHHDGHPVLTWMISNVTAKEDANENVFPRKEKSESKIDGAVALIMALGRAMAGGDGGDRVVQGFVEIPES